MVWEDQGLYFTLAFNAILLAVLLSGAFTLHKLPQFRRILRPNRPGSRTSTFFLPPNSLFQVSENEVLEAVGVTPMIYVLILKYFAFVFMGMCPTSIMIVALCATDRYNNEYRRDNDPDLCSEKSSSECTDSVKCTFAVHVDGGTCLPAVRTGLFDFSVTNIVPETWRLYLFALACVLCCIPVFFVTRGIVNALCRIIRASYTMPIYNGLKYGGFATVGARTVLISGIPPDAVALTSAEKFFEYIFADTDRKRELLKERVPNDFWKDPLRRIMCKTTRKKKRHGKHATFRESIPPTEGNEPTHLRTPADSDVALREDEIDDGAEDNIPSDDTEEGDLTYERNNSTLAHTVSVSEAHQGTPRYSESQPQQVLQDELSRTTRSRSSNNNNTTTVTLHSVIVPAEQLELIAQKKQQDDEQLGETMRDDLQQEFDDHRHSRDGAPDLLNTVAFASLERPRSPIRNSKSGLTLAERSRPLGPPTDLRAASWLIAQHHCIRKTLVIIRKSPPKLMDLIDEEKETLVKLTDAIASERQETDPEKKPVKKRLISRLWKQVEAVKYEMDELKRIREQISKWLPKREGEDMTGAVTLAFDRASSAYAFVRQHNIEQGQLSNSRARVLGPREGVVWSNLGETRAEERIRFVLMVIFFAALCFFWGIPVAILGNVDKLEGIPGIGPALGSVVNTLPVTVSGTLSAILPAIVLALFNLMLPPMLRFFSKMGGVKTKQQIARRVLLMCGVFSIMSGIVIQAALQGGFTQAIDLMVSPSWQGVVELIIAIVSPTGGYWYAYLISAACVGTLLELFVIGPVLIAMIIGRFVAGRQEEYDRLFDAREFDYSYMAGRHLFFGAIGMFFHGTVAFLQPFAVLYSLAAYLIERSVILDGVKAETVNVIDYSFALGYVNGILSLHTVAAVGNVIVCALKYSVGSPILASVALGCSLGMQFWVQLKLGPLVKPEPELVASVERDMDNLGLPREQVEDAVPYVPDYATYEIDECAVEKIEAKTFKKVDRTWPKPGMKLVEDPPATFLCFGTAAVKQQQLDSLANRIHILEKENDQLRAFYQEANRRANYRRVFGSPTEDDDRIATPQREAVDLTHDARYRPVRYSHTTAVTIDTPILPPPNSPVDGRRRPALSRSTVVSSSATDPFMEPSTSADPPRSSPADSPASPQPPYGASGNHEG
jgi:hypothetical protein